MNPSQGGWVIFLTMLAAMLLMVVHLPQDWPGWLGWFRPNWLLLVLFFWVVEVPHRVGLITMWLTGFFVDVLLADPLGTNGLILAGVTYLAWRFFERLRMYSVLQQCVVLYVLIASAEILRFLVRGLESDVEWNAGLFLIPMISMALWPVVYLLLLRLRTGLRVE